SNDVSCQRARRAARRDRSPLDRLYSGCGAPWRAREPVHPVAGRHPVVFGGDVFWSLIALLCGQLVGGAVMALHAAQGPQLGLPQMISSRVQFGVYGAVIPIVAVCLMYIGFSASGCVLAGQAIGRLLDVDDAAGIGGFTILIVVVTTFGHRGIH